MGRSCCVPGCKSNYTVVDTSIFRFPKDETLREIWLRNIHREDFEVKNQTVVCVKHFEPKFVVREDVFPTEYGEPVRIIRKIPKLTNDAIPTIFPDPPSYRAVLRPTARRERVRKVISGDQRNLVKRPDSEGDVISNSDDFKGMNLRAAVGEAQEESPTSDYVDDSASEPADSTSSSGHSPSPAPLPLVATVQPPSKLKHPQHMPYDPLVHVNSKPPYSFSCLIFMAIEDSPNRALPVKEIYAWILQHFPYFKNAPTGWKNSVRYNLSLNKCFRKVEKAPNLGKGSLWMVDSVYRPNLLQALQKSPFYPFRSLDRVSMATKHVHVPSPVNPLNRNDLVVIKPNSRLPNPELFPFLSRHLAASGVEGLRSCEPPRADSDTTTDDADSLDDGDAAAATAMLALKHGPRMLSPRKLDWYKRPDNEEKALDMRHARKRMRASKNNQDLDSDHCIPVITTSPSEDHTYSAGHTVLATSSPDEAYEEGSESEDDPKPLAVNGVRPQTTAKPSLLSDAEEQRKIAEGADALLNLAGITTRKRSQSSEFQTAPSETTSETPVSRVSLRGRRRGSGGVGFRPRLLRSVRPVKKSTTASSSVGSISPEPPRQRVAHRRKSQNPVSINTNNNTIDAGTNNNNNIAKVAKTLKQMQRNTNENEGVGRTKRASHSTASSQSSSTKPNHVKSKPPHTSESLAVDSLTVS